MPKRYTHSEFVAYIRKQCARVGSIQGWSKKYGLSQGYANQLANGKQTPGRKALRILGFRRETRYVREK